MMFTFKLMMVFLFVQTALTFVKIGTSLRNTFHKSSIYKSSKLCFPDDDSDKRKINNNNDYGYHGHFVDEYKDMYTLIWYDCPECKELLNTIVYLNLKVNYIDMGVYLDKCGYLDDMDYLNNDLLNKPLFYKDVDLIGDDLFDIYSEIYSTV